MNPRLHILIADSSEIIRCGVSTLLQRISSLSMEISETNEISSISSVNNRRRIDIIIMSPSFLGMTHPNVIKQELGEQELKIIALQNSFNEPSVLQNYDHVISIYDSSLTIKDKISQLATQSDKQSQKKELSAREKEIIVCVVKGMTNKVIADTLSLSTHTVVTHRRNIASKLQIHSPSGLTIYAIVNKLVSLSDVKDSINEKDEE
ncbi:MAG: LuxR C-terminal-related transcriptional regulator [Rikenellaceae bacterium]